MNSFFWNMVHSC